MTNLNMLFEKEPVSKQWVAETASENDAQRASLRLLPIVLAVALAHAALVALVVTQSSNKEILIATTTPPASVRVTMVSPPPEPPRVEPVPPKPQIITAEKAERTVAQPKKVVEPPKPKPLPKPKPKPMVKPVEPAKPVEPKMEEPTQASQALAAMPTPPSEKMMDLPAAGAKDVQSVGCRVPAPPYPRQARRLKIEGTVFVRLQIDAQGRAESATVVRSSGNQDLDEAARKTVLSASCTPYMENGRAISVRAVQPVSFRLTR